MYHRYISNALVTTDVFSVAGTTTGVQCCSGFFNLVHEGSLKTWATKIFDLSVRIFVSCLKIY
jgi:hypothetical protein